MSRILKQSTSVDVAIGPFLDETDGRTAETALTLTQPDIRLKKNNANWAQKAAAQTLAHEENGYYEVTLDATDTNTLGLLRLAVNEAGALPVWEDFLVVTANVFDTFFSTASFSVAVGTGGLVAASFATGAIDAVALDTTAVNEVRDAVFAKVVDGALTLQDSLKLHNAALGGKSSGHATGAPVYRDPADTKNRITATTDADGNRSAVTLDVT